MDTAKLRLKKIAIDELRVGMFIVNLGRSWLSHPFLRNQLKIASEKQIQKMRRYGIQEVYIDPERGMDVPSPEPHIEDSIIPVLEDSGENIPAAETPAKTEEPSLPANTLSSTPGRTTNGPFEQMEKAETGVFWEQNVGQAEKNLLSRQSPVVTRIVDQVPYAQEIKQAQVIQEEAQSAVRKIMHDVRMGRSIESDWVKRVVNKMVDSILRNHGALVSLARIKKYDEYTYVHSLNVCILCLSMGRHMSLSHEDMLEIGIGAFLHDVGKMKMPPHILQKAERLSENDWMEVRKHPIYSWEIMEQAKGIPERSRQIALQHHERCDGSGYPYGLKGDAIGLFGKVAGIVDFYDAITADRNYQKGIPPHEGIRQVYERSPVEFDRSVVDQFIQCIGIYPFGTLVLLDTEEIGIVCGVNSETLLRPKVLVIYRNSKVPYAQPLLADLREGSEQSRSYKRTIIMPLDAQKWNIRTEAYLSVIRNNLDGQGLTS